MSASLLELHDVSAGYGRTTVVNKLSFSVAEKDRLAIIGRNGVGKTTAMRAIMGLCSWCTGRILFEGQDISPLAPHERAMHGLGYVPQTRDIFPSLTVEENLVSGLKGRPRRAIDDAYAMFPRLAERRRLPGMQLSGGEQQMLSVARALLGRPRLLLLDEPLEGLAPLVRHDLLRAFHQMSQDIGITVIMVEQQVKEALAYSKTVMVMERGASVHSGWSQDLLPDDQALERFVGLADH